MNRRYRTILVLGATAAIPAIADAHITAFGHGFAAGLAHPFSGLDHLLILFACGWCAQWLARWSSGMALAIGVTVLQGYAHTAGMRLNDSLEWFVVGLLTTSTALVGMGALLAHLSRVVRLGPERSRR